MLLSGGSVRERECRRKVTKKRRERDGSWWIRIETARSKSVLTSRKQKRQEQDVVCSMVFFVLFSLRVGRESAFPLSVPNMTPKTGHKHRKIHAAPLTNQEIKRPRWVASQPARPGQRSIALAQAFPAFSACVLPCHLAVHDLFFPVLFSRQDPLLRGSTHSI